MLAAVERLKNQTEQQAEDDATRAFLDVMLVYSGGANDRVESGAAWRKSARVAQALLYLGAIALGPVPFLVSSDSRSQLMERRWVCVLDRVRFCGSPTPRHSSLLAANPARCLRP